MQDNRDKEVGVEFLQKRKGIKIIKDTQHTTSKSQNCTYTGGNSSRFSVKVTGLSIVLLTGQCVQSRCSASVIVRRVNKKIRQLSGVRHHDNLLKPSSSCWTLLLFGTEVRLMIFRALRQPNVKNMRHLLHAFHELLRNHLQCASTVFAKFLYLPIKFSTSLTERWTIYL